MSRRNTHAAKAARRAVRRFGPEGERVTRYGTKHRPSRRRNWERADPSLFPKDAWKIPGCPDPEMWTDREGDDACSVVVHKRPDGTVTALTIEWHDGRTFMSWSEKQQIKITSLARTSRELRYSRLKIHCMTPRMRTGSGVPRPASALPPVSTRVWGRWNPYCGQLEVVGGSLGYTRGSNQG